MKKIFIILVLISLFGISKVNAGDCINSNNIIGEITGYEVGLVHYGCDGKIYTNYYYNGKDYKIGIPQSKNKFISLEVEYRNGTLSPLNEYYEAVLLNELLNGIGFESLYY